MPIASTFLRIVAVGGALLAVALLVAAHRRRNDLRPMQVSLSSYFTGPTRSLMISAYGALGVALIGVAGAVGAVEPAARIVSDACLLAAVLLLPVAATTSRFAGSVVSERKRWIHRSSSLVAFCGIGVAMAVAAARPSSFPLTAIVGAIGAGLSVLVVASKPGPTYGLKQRLLVGCVCLWIVVVAIQ